MKNLIKFLLAAALSAIAVSLANASLVVDDNNPGVLDDPACRGLIVAQIKAQGQMLSDYDVKYDRTIMLSDGKGGANIYRATNRKKGEVWEIVIALHSEQVKAK